MFQLTHFMKYHDRRDEKRSLFPSKPLHFSPCRLVTTAVYATTLFGSTVGIPHLWYRAMSVFVSFCR